MKDLVIFGIGQVAEVVQYYLGREGGRRVTAFTVDGDYIRESRHLDLPVVPFETLASKFPPDACDIFVAMSFKDVNVPRARKVAQAEALGYTLASHVSPHAAVWSGLQLQPNTFIMQNCIVEPYANIGKNVFLWSGS